MLRLFDVILSLIGILLLFPVFVVIYVLGYFDTGSPLFVQDRVGRNKKSFRLVKFRTMSIGTKSVASHLADNASVTKFGRFLRKSKLDELPQLINVLIGDMSLVGPRPNLFNQTDLIIERDKLGVYNVRPGITGLAQISNIDMSTPKELALLDKKMIDTINVKQYFSYIFSTVLGKGRGDAIR